LGEFNSEPERLPDVVSAPELLIRLILCGRSEILVDQFKRFFAASAVVPTETAQQQIFKVSYHFVEPVTPLIRPP
jgi:hypothetical protein